MNAKFSRDNDCLRSPQVSGGKLRAPAGNLHGAFVVRVMVVFSNLMAFFFIQHQTNSELLRFRKSWTIHCWLFNPLSTKMQLAETFFTNADLIGNWPLSLFSLSRFIKCQNCPAKLGFGLECHLKPQVSKLSRKIRIWA